MKNKYHSLGIGKNKKIKEERKKPIPITLMGLKLVYKKDCPNGQIYLMKDSSKYQNITKEK